MQSPIPRQGHRWLVLGICCMSLFVVSMDATVVNVALPSIGRELDAPIAGLQWTIDAYTLVVASLLLLSGFTADRIGRRRTFQLGLSIFTLGSLLCSLAPSIGWLIAFRMLQAIGGSMLNPVAMSIITATFDDAKQRAQAVGIWAAVVGVSFGIGPLVGGWLVMSTGWRGIFWINLPIGVAAIVLTAVFVPESRGQAGRRFDPIGQLLAIALFGGLVAGLIEGPRLGWSSPGTVCLFVLAGAALVAFVAHGRRAEHPFVDLRFFRSAPFDSALVTAVLLFSVQSGFLFLIALYLQEVRGLSPFDTGLHTLPLAAAQFVAAPIAGRLVANDRVRTAMVFGGVCITVTAAGLVPTSATTPFPLLLTLFALLGLGLGMLNPPITNSAVSGMPRSQSGSAAALASTGRQLGVSLGVALAGSITGLGAAAGVGPSFVEEARPVWVVFAGFGVAIVVIGLAGRSRWAMGTAEGVRGLLETGTVRTVGAPRGG